MREIITWLIVFPITLFIACLLISLIETGRQSRNRGDWQ